MHRKDTQSTSEIASSYDYILVGAGSAGSVLANELARLEAGSILVIEHGRRAGHYQSRRPALYPHLFQNPDLSHFQKTSPQGGLAGRSILLPSGRGLGGSSLLNAMILLRPSKADLRRWHELLGSSWHPETLSSLLEDLWARLHENIDASPELHPISQQILDHMESDSVSSSIAQTIFPYTRFQKAGRRESAWRVFRRQSSSGKIDVLRGHSANCVAFSSDKAMGVDVSNSPRHTNDIIRAHKAIVLCAGALKTPTILMKSGIGPKETISVHRRLLLNSPYVGQNLSDHLVFPVSLACSMTGLPSQFDATLHRQWLTHGTGPLASNIAELGAFGYQEHSSTYRLLNDTEDVKPHFQWHITPTHYLEYPARTPATNAVSIGVTMLHPESRGSVQWLKDGSFAVDPNYLSNPSDGLEFTNVVQWTRTWIENSPWRSLLADELIPGPRRPSDEAVTATIKRLASTIYHYVGTCALGKSADSVCDPSFRVRGCQSLYICDGSALPEQVSGNPQFSIMLMAMKLARELANLG